jgi:hypothetical protein
MRGFCARACANLTLLTLKGCDLDVDVVSSSHAGCSASSSTYRVPVAKSAPNSDCTVAGDPNHNTACQAKWSTAKNI